MNILLNILLFGVVMAPVLVYLFWPTGMRALSNAPSEADYQKEAVLANLLDLDQDLKLGKLSQEDYVVLKAQLMREAEALYAKTKAR